MWTTDQRKQRHLMYLENKDGDIDGAVARVGWVTFSKSRRTVYYRGRRLQRAKGGGIGGNYFDVNTGETYWVSGVKRRESNAHPTCTVQVLVDEDAQEEYARIRA